MLVFTQGNLLEADAEALVNTVNTVGVMGKGIALMFKEAFPDNFRQYEEACKRKELQAGHILVTRRDQLIGPKWIVNFATKGHWRYPSKLQWVESGLDELREFIVEKRVKSVAIPPLGSGNGGLIWRDVRSLIEAKLGDMSGVAVLVYEPTREYQNVAKKQGLEKLTPARAMIAEAIRRYCILGMECTVLEVQKIAYFIQEAVIQRGVDNPLRLSFDANKFGPYSPALTHLLDNLDGSYLHCEKRMADADPLSLVWFEESKKDKLSAYLNSEGKPYSAALEDAASMFDGFESPLGMELLATVDWMVRHMGVEPTTVSIKKNLARWPGGQNAGQRKLKMFTSRMIGLALDRVVGHMESGVH